MKYPSIVVSWMIFSQACFAQPELLSRFPDCTVLCFKAALPNTSCLSTNITCLCANPDFFREFAACNAGNCDVVETLQSTNETYAACGIPVRDQTATLIGTTASFGGMALLMVILRLLDRGASGQANLGWDDVLIGLAGVSSIMQNVPVLVAANYGFGRDMWGMTPHEITSSLHWLWFTYPLYMTTEAFCQTSILAFYLRIMTDPKTRKIVWGFIVMVACFGCANLFTMIFQCWPLNYFWNGWKGFMVPNTVINMNLFSFVRGGIEIGLDLTILILPLPMLAKLQMSLKRKSQIMSMFCVGFVITGVSCARLHALIQFAKTSNPTYDNTSTIYWCMIESNLFIVVACMPSFHALIHKAWTAASSGCSNYADNSYFSNSKLRLESRKSLPFGVILKSTDVKIYNREERKRPSRGWDSDVELVLRPDRV